MALVGDDEPVQIELETVLHSGAVDLRHQAAGCRERGPIKAYPVPDIDQLVRRLPLSDTDARETRNTIALLGVIEVRFASAVMSAGLIMRSILCDRPTRSACPAHQAVGCWWVSLVARIVMCRNIKTLHNFKPPATQEEIRASSLQFVRKLSGFTRPAKANQLAFDRAVDQVARAAYELLDALVTNAPPRYREVEAAKARARAADRFRSPETGRAT